MSEHPAPQEDRLELPSEWQRLAMPRRDNSVRFPVELDPEAPAIFAQRLQRAPEALRRSAELDDSDRSLLARGTAFLEGEPDPLGAAVVAELLDRLHDLERRDPKRPEVPRRGKILRRNHFEAWVLQFGLPFTACAALHQLTIDAPLNHPVRRLRIRSGRPAYGRWLSHSDSGALLPFLRQLFAAAPDDEYRRIVEAVEPLRDAPARRYAAAVLLPDRTEWVTELLADPERPSGTATFDRLEWSLMGTPEHLALHRKTIDPKTYTWNAVADLVANLGVDALPVLAATLRSKRGAPLHRSQLLQAVALLPSDDAFRLLLDSTGDRWATEALESAVARFPARAARLLVARAATAEPAERFRLLGLIKWHDARFPADRVGDAGPEPATPARPEPTTPTLPEAPLESLPKVLVAPPWTEKRKSNVPQTIAGLQAPAPQVVGRPGEHERALALEPNLVDWDPDTYWDDSLFRDYRTGWRYADGLLSQLARKGAAFADDVVATICKHPWHSRALLPIRSAAAAGAAAHWLVRLKDGRRAALDWFDRHGLHAVPLLVPEAFGPQGYQRASTRGALRLLGWRYGRDAVVGAAEPHGPAAVDAVAAVLEDPYQPLLNRPSTGAWADPDRLPPVLTADRTATLPSSAVAHLVSVLAQWSPRVPYPGVDAVAEHCDRDSLARFSLALAELWIDVGAPSHDNWAVVQLGRFGGPEAAALIEARVPRWGARYPEYSAQGMDALAALPAETGFPPLYRLSRGKLKPQLKQLADQHCAAVAARLGYEPEALADRLAPDFGLGDPATLTLDFGPRAFHIKADDRLNLSVIDAAGKTRARLPRPGVRDDAEAGAASIARFRKLAKDLAAELAFQSARLEDAMLAGRVWDTESFARLTANPVLASLARGLLWLGETPDGPRGFRLAEDGSFADAEDKPIEIQGRVRLAHPVLLGPDLAAWTEVFADYEILQPFPQLARPALTLAPEEARTGILDRFTGATATWGALREVLDWKALDWGEHRPNGTSVSTHLFARELPREALNPESAAIVDSAHLLAEIDPSPDLSDPDPEGRHRILAVWFSPTKNRRRGAPTLRGDALDPVLVAEILAGLGRATGLIH
jgi:hypothetical protein